MPAALFRLVCRILVSLLVFAVCLTGAIGRGLPQIRGRVATKKSGRCRLTNVRYPTDTIRKFPYATPLPRAEDNSTARFAVTPLQWSPTLPDQPNDEAAPSIHEARMAVVLRRVAPGIPFSDGLKLSAKLVASIPPNRSEGCCLAMKRRA
jgi:hypothetical protein